MIQISHEVPLFLLKESIKFNDYDYALVHLFEKYDIYYDFFKNSINKLKRKVILDNSAFELKKSFNPDKFAFYVEELKPTIYIIPDYLRNKEETLKLFNDFKDKYKNLPGKRMGVVQGINLKEIIDCYKYMKNYCDIIGIPAITCLEDNELFDLKDDKLLNTYINLSSLSIHKKRIMSRYKVIKTLYRENLVDSKVKFHLLGINLPQEIILYKNIKNIESVDTSSPIVHGILGIKFTSQGLEEKNETKLEKLLEIRKENCNLSLIYENIKIFRSFLED